MGTEKKLNTQIGVVKCVFETEIQIIINNINLLNVKKVIYKLINT